MAYYKSNGKQKRPKTFKKTDKTVYYLYFEKKGDLVRIDSAWESKWKELQGTKPMLPQVMEIKENPREVELCLIWLWREFRVHPRRTWYKYEYELDQLVEMLPKKCPPHFTQEEVRRMYWLEFMRAGNPTGLAYKEFIRNLTHKLFTRTEIAPEDTEVWEDVPDEFRYFAYKAAQVSSLGRIRWWRDMMSEEIASDKKLKRRLLTLDHYHYAKTHIYDGNMCVTAPKSPHTQIRKIVLSAFREEIEEGLEISHLNGNKLDCRLENLTFIPTQEKPRQPKKRLSEADKKIIRTRCAFNRKHGHSLKAYALAVEYGVSVKTIYRTIQDS